MRRGEIKGRAVDGRHLTRGDCHVIHLHGTHGQAVGGRHMGSGVFGQRWALGGALGLGSAGLHSRAAGWALPSRRRRRRPRTGV